ncbi:sulfotransferase family 2 domain-containing protein [Alteromonas australica]|uniref:sulfotransferase family 2 domain-containing protein n=1 Tax=Alteromonas australica TaxID=589873 RepID=UPI0023558A40|nr:sulfotransferase family 2 domain-containing protein [Alteromonas australica]|tara:strand:- start:14909 stop:15574 length:666 start_codon:yes stop_codon:yes gene_type:complete
MLVSHQKKFIFFKTMKTAGTSVEGYFEKYCVPPNNYALSHHRDEQVSTYGIVGSRGPKPDAVTFYNHMPAKEIKSQVGEQVFNNYFKFTVVRNPYDKLVSAFYHFFKHRHPEKFVDEDVSDVHMFRQWLKTGGKIRDSHIYMLDTQEVVDFYIHYESLHRDIESVCNKLAIEFKPTQLPAFKREFRDRSIPIHAFYDDESTAIVKQLYQFELQRFNYSMPK